MLIPAVDSSMSSHHFQDKFQISELHIQSSSRSDFTLPVWCHISLLLHKQMKSQPCETTCGSPSYHALPRFLAFVPTVPSAYSVFPYPPLFSWWSPVSPSSLLSCHFLWENFPDFTRLNDKLLLLGSSSALYTPWLALFNCILGTRLCFCPHC